jgi:hypothetical protein
MLIVSIDGGKQLDVFPAPHVTFPVMTKSFTVISEGKHACEMGHVEKSPFLFEYVGTSTATSEPAMTSNDATAATRNGGGIFFLTSKKTKPSILLYFALLDVRASLFWVEAYLPKIFPVPVSLLLFLVVR